MTDAGALDQTGLAQQAHRGQRRARRHAQVVQAAAFGAAEGLPRPCIDGCRSAVGTGRQRNVVQAGRRMHPSRLRLILRDCRTRRSASRAKVAEASASHLIERHADDAAARDEPRARPGGTGRAAACGATDRPWRPRAPRRGGISDRHPGVSSAPSDAHVSCVDRQRAQVWDAHDAPGEWMESWSTNSAANTKRFGHASASEHLCPATNY